MFPRAIRSLAIFVCALTVFWPASAQADEVAAYLEQHGLDRLLAAHLEQQLEHLTGDDHDEAMIRLADLYARLLETASDPADRVELQERGRRLLTQSSSDSAYELRLALLRASCRGAEAAAEQHRLRLAEDVDVAQAIQTFTDVIPKLQQLRTQIKSRLDSLRRRVQRASGSNAMMLNDEAQKTRRLYAQCTFITAWALYYQSWLNERPDNAHPAQRLFAQLLEFGDDTARPEHVSEDLRSTEVIARSILGMALCKSMTASTSSAVEWVRLLEHPSTWAPLREQAPAWHIVIRLEHSEFIEARSVLDHHVEAGGEVPTYWLRLIAVSALEAQSASRSAGELAREAMTQLAARGELTDVLDLARRYGLESLGKAGFAARYVQAVLGYHKARAAHAGEEPTTDPNTAATFAEAADHFAAAREEDDSSRYPEAAADCTRLIAWCRFFEGRLSTARNAFMDAAETLPTAEAPEALWMAIVCADRLHTASPENKELLAELSALITRFAGEYPSHERTPMLMLRQATASGDMSLELAEQLLAVPEGNTAYDASRQYAAQILYQLFRRAGPTQRGALGEKYLALALSLHEVDAFELENGDDTVARRFINRGRRILEVALRHEIARTTAARAVFDKFDHARTQHPELYSTIKREMLHRHVQERLLSHDVDGARYFADELWALDQDDAWTRFAHRAVLAAGQAQFIDETLGIQRRASAAQLVARYGKRVLAVGADDADFDEETLSTIGVVVADAQFWLWRDRNEETAGRESLALYEAILIVHPRHSKYLRAVAQLSEAFNKPEQAMTCWRTLVAGTSSGSERWFEAKFSLIRLLARHDPPRAREVMDQHRLLNPEYGPDPWGQRLRALDERMTRDTDQSESAGEGSA